MNSSREKPSNLAEADGIKFAQSHECESSSTCQERSFEAMPKISDYEAEVQVWLKENYTPPISGLRDPNIEEFFEICQSMAEFDEARGAYTYEIDSKMLSDETTSVRIKLLRSVLARDFPDISSRSKYLVAKNLILAEYFNPPNRPIRDDLNLERMNYFFATGEYPTEEEGA